jgi:hypothetical protein
MASANRTRPGQYLYDDWTTPVTGVDATSAGTLTTGNSPELYTTNSIVTVNYVPQEYNQYRTNVGTTIYLDFVEDEKVIHPRLYFKFVKSKLTKLEEKKLNKRLTMLQKFVKSAEDMGQQALYENFARKIAITVKEQELWACGIEYFTDKKYVNQYMDKVKDVEIGFSKLENYDRPVPTRVERRIKKIKKLGLFDELRVLYLNYKEKKDVDGEKKAEKIKTNKEKIKEKDPILFGVQKYMPDKLYYIIDWIDEHCDLTLDKFIDDIKKSDPDYDIDKIDDIDEDLIQKLVKESRERYTRLQNTNQKNYKSLMKEEDGVIKEKTFKDEAYNFFKDTKDKIMSKFRKTKK